MDPSSDPSLLVRAVRAAASRKGFDRLALRALRKAHQLLSLAIGTRLAQMRESDLSHNRLGVRIEEQALHLRLLQEANDILAARWEKIPDRHRPHYTPQLRYRILRVKDLQALSQREAARMFAVSGNTIARWEAESETHPEQETVGSLVTPDPPVRRYADVLRYLVQSMGLCGFGGNDLIARILARAGWKISSRTAGRIRKEPRPREPEPQAPAGAARRVTARYPNHLWMTDFTEIPGFLRIFSFKLAVVFDAFSRMPLAARVFFSEPTAHSIARLFRRAAKTHGTPRHSVSDHGAQFTAKVFQQQLATLHVRHRFGAIDKTGSIALIERLWRTLKDTLALRTLKPLALADLCRRLEFGLLYYAYHRPHQALDGATPAEIFFGLTPAHLSAIHPPRGRPTEEAREPPFQIAYLDPARLLPLLVKKAA